MKSRSESVRSSATGPKGPAVDPLDWIGENNAPDILKAMERQGRRRSRRRMRTTAGVAVIFLLSILAWRSRPLAPTPTVSSSIVHVPERRILPDGTVMELKPGSVVVVKFTDAQRRMALTKGEAHFQVTKNKERPFIVAVGSVEFRAVGTAFSLERQGAQVELLVTEGRVAIDQSGTVSASSIAPAVGIAPSVLTLATLDAGYRTVVPLEPTASTVPRVLMAASAEIGGLEAWRIPRLEFSGTPLGEAVPLINEHSAVKLVLADSSLASVRVSGILRADNIETLRELLSEAYGIKSEYRTKTEIVLSKAR